MTKKFLLIVLMAMGSLFSLAQQSPNPVTVVLQTHYFDPYEALGEKPRSPIATPLVYLDAYTLTFSTTHPEYILYIKDENETVVYSTVVSESETTVVLPAALSGSYEIVLVMGNWMFTGWIEL